MQRRTFLQGCIASAVLSFTGCSSTTKLSRFTPLGTWQTTLCQGCTSWCSVQAYVVDNRVTNVRGNVYSKANGKDICVRPHLALEQQYDPDRIKTPLKRTKPDKARGVDAGFVPISWDEALDTIADKLLALRKNNTPERFALLRGRYSHMRDILYSALPKIIGTPNSISHSSICAEAEKFASYYTEGFWDYNDFDLANTRYVLSWGADPLSSNRQVAHFINVWNNVSQNAKVAVIDPHFSATATKANHWLPIIPGEDGALVSAIAHTILVQNLWYRPFVGDFIDKSMRFIAGQTIDKESFDERHTHGIIDWWNLELLDKTPKWAAKRCGIDEETIIHIARDFALAAPRAISWVSTGIAMQVRGAYAAMGAHALNALVGSIDNIGGVLQNQKIPINPTPDMTPYMDDLAKRHTTFAKIDHRGALNFPAMKKKPGGGVVTNNTAQGIIDEDPYPIEVLIGYWNNPAFSCAAPTQWEQALSKVPFSVHITTHLAETSHFADIVLPASFSMFEKYAFVKNKQNLHSYVHIQKPVITPLFDSKSDETHIPFLLAQKLAQKGFDNLWRYYVENFKDPATNQSPTNEEEFELFALKYYTKPLYDGSAVAYGDRLNSFEELLEKGVWNSHKHPYKTRWGKFKTKSGKFEFYSQTLKHALQTHANNHNTTIDNVLKVNNYTAQGNLAFVPHYEVPVRYGSSDEYPLILSEHRSRLNREARSANSKLYYAFRDVDPGEEIDEDVIKINPKTAKALGLDNMQTVEVVSPFGRITCKLKYFEGVRPGMAIKAYGQGHWAYGRNACTNYAQGIARGGNVNALYNAQYERLSGSSVRHGGFIRVRIETKRLK